MAVDHAVAELTQRVIAEGCSEDSCTAVGDIAVAEVAKAGGQPETARALEGLPEEVLADVLYIAESAGQDTREITEEIDTSTRLGRIVDGLAVRQYMSTGGTEIPFYIHASTDEYHAWSDAHGKELRAAGSQTRYDMIADNFGEDSEVGALLSDISARIERPHTERIGTEIIDKNTGEAIRPIFNIELPPSTAEQVAEIVSARRQGVKFLIRAMKELTPTIKRIDDNVQVANQSSESREPDMPQRVAQHEAEQLVKDRRAEIEAFVTTLEADIEASPIDRAQVLVNAVSDQCVFIESEIERRQALVKEEDGWASFLDLYNFNRGLKFILRSRLWGDSLSRDARVFNLGYQMHVNNSAFGNFHTRFAQFPSISGRGITGTLADLYVTQEDVDDYRELSEICDEPSLNNFSERILHLAYEMLPDGTYLNHMSNAASLEGLVLNEGLAPRSGVELKPGRDKFKINGGFVHFTPHGTIAEEYTQGGSHARRGGVVTMVPVRRVMEVAPHRQLEDAYLSNEFYRGSSLGSVQESYAGVTFPDLDDMPEAFKARMRALLSVDEDGLRPTNIRQGQQHNLSFAASDRMGNASHYRFCMDEGMIVATNGLEVLAELYDKYPSAATDRLDKIIAVSEINLARPPEFRPRDGMTVWMSSGSKFVDFRESDLNRHRRNVSDINRMSPEAVAHNYHNLVNQGLNPEDILRRGASNPEVRVESVYIADALSRGMSPESALEIYAQNEHALLGIWRDSRIRTELEAFNIGVSELMEASANILKSGSQRGWVIDAILRVEDEDLSRKLVDTLRDDPDGLIMIEDARQHHNNMRGLDGKEPLPEILPPELSLIAVERRMQRELESRDDVASWV